MNITKLYSYKSPRQVWRILISDSGKLILETRDPDTKEVFFHCFEIETGKKFFSDLQLDEKYWLGIEAVYKEIIFFHKIPKPDLPGHKEIIAFDISEQKVLWINKELSFLFIYNDRIYGFKQGFEERYFYALNFMSGELVQEFGDDYKTINTLRNKAESEKDWSVYIYPKIFANDESDLRIGEAIRAQIKNLDIEGKVEYNFYGNLLLFNYHTKILEGSFVNRFSAVDLDNSKIVLSEVLNAKSASLFTDSFFVYRNFLFLLREKNEVIVYGME